MTVVLITEIKGEWAKMGCCRFAGSEVPANLRDGSLRIQGVRPRYRLHDYLLQDTRRPHEGKGRESENKG